LTAKKKKRGGSQFYGDQFLSCKRGGEIEKKNPKGLKSDPDERKRTPRGIWNGWGRRKGIGDHEEGKGRGGWRI